jgi:hypothetical protein
MGCLLSVLLTAAPRLVLLFIWLFTARVDLAFEGWLWPLLGFLFFPFTMLAYVLFYDPLTGLSGLSWLFIGVAFILDLGALAIAYAANRHRLPGGVEEA